MSAPLFDPETGEIIEEASASSSPASSSPASSSPASESAPLPQAMSLDQARALMVREHGVAVGSDDPILLSVTLHQGFIADYEAMLARHDQSIKALLGATGDAYAQTVERVLDGMKDKTVQASIATALALVSDQSKALEAFRRTLTRHRRWIAVLTVLSWLAAFLVLTLLFTVLR